MGSPPAPQTPAAASAGTTTATKDCYYPRWLRVTVALSFLAVLNLMTDRLSSFLNLSDPFKSLSTSTTKTTRTASTSTTSSLRRGGSINSNSHQWVEQAQAGLKRLEEHVQLASKAHVGFEDENETSRLLFHAVLQATHTSSIHELIATNTPPSQPQAVDDAPSLLPPLWMGWKPCANLWSHDQKNRPLQITVLGGSSAARPADHCHDESSPYDGRYSNVLQSALQSDGFQVEVQNMAQGSTTSVYSAMMLDQLLDSNVDLIVWDHSINDFSMAHSHTPMTHPGAEGASSSSASQQTALHQSPAQMLRFFLTRVQAHFARHNQPVPPILFLYTWKQDVGFRSAQDILKRGHDHASAYPRAYAESMRVIQEHAAQGMDLAVVDVARWLPRQLFVDQKHDILDDRHHPACAANHYIVQWMQYVLYQTIVNSRSDSGTEECRRPQLPVPVVEDPRTSMTTTTSTTQSRSDNDSLADLLFQPSTHIQGLTQWQPTRSTTTSTASSDVLSILPATLEEASGYVHNIFPAADMPGRQDRKMAYRLPYCFETNHNKLRLEVDTRNSASSSSTLQWLGLVTAGTPDTISFHVNGVPQRLSGQGPAIAQLASPVNLPRAQYDWISVLSTKDDNDKQQDYVVLEFCDATPAHELSALTAAGKKVKRAWLHQLVGVFAAALVE